MVTDILPVQGMVARLTVTAPEVLVGPDADPHHHQLRPSQAQALDAADLFVWIGPSLTPALERARASLAGDVETVELLRVEGVHLRPFQEMEGHDGHDHGHDHGHNHGGSGELADVDPHAWLDPDNMGLWAKHIADILADRDPAMAGTYKARAAIFSAEMTAAKAAIEAASGGVEGIKLATTHDALAYIAEIAGVEIAQAIVPADGSAPSAARIKALSEQLSGDTPVCMLADRTKNTRLIATVLPDTPHSVVDFDPLGRSLEMGPNFVSDLMGAFTTALDTCSAELASG